jgi:hypothetical protein
MTGKGANKLAYDSGFAIKTENDVALLNVA